MKKFDIEDLMSKDGYKPTPIKRGAAWIKEKIEKWLAKQKKEQEEKED